ncbi:DUF3320 domain-containing protein [Terrabacter ginsenosidimutans]|uniref:DUF3320 domain-containing protein n=2 Tax=Terrabacter ginsenosidimutans TaxID=490575 RepID=A0ABP7CTJ0_9MICO
MVRGEDGTWLAFEETSNAITFVEARGDQMSIVPFVGDASAVGLRPFARDIQQSSWLDGEAELLVDVTALSSYADRGQVLDLMNNALDYWATRSAPATREESAFETQVVEPLPISEAMPVDFSDSPVDEVAEPAAAAPLVTVDAQLRADISDQWSWASSAARIPQITDLRLALSEPLGHARIRVAVRDADVQFGAKIVHDGPLPAGPTDFGSINVPLSARVMSQVEERRGADCVITLEDAATGRVLSRHEEAIDVQPRDLWFWGGDPRRSEEHARLVQRHEALAAKLREDPEHLDTDVEQELAAVEQALRAQGASSSRLARSLLASFVRPNHPEIAAVAREAAERLGRSTGDSSFFAFQISDVQQAEERADATVAAIYEALQARSISYSEPPPGWDYRDAGQRIRDHGDVARAGLGTCMDTTVLTAAVIEQAGLHPVLVLVSGHIFVGYWRRDPLPEHGSRPDWYPGTPVVADPAAIGTLIEGGWLGVIETTAFTAGKNTTASQARSIARHTNVAQALEEDFLLFIDVAAARRAGVSPLPAVNERSDGITEIVEYRPGGAPAVTQISSDIPDRAARDRRVDDHPARYRTWKSSLFSLNATNALLNLGSNARVQPLALPPESLGVLEDKLNQDVAFSLHSGYDVPEVWRARDIANALQLAQSGAPDDRRELVGHLNDKKLYIQRMGRSGGKPAPITPATFFKEIRSMAHGAKTAREERGMNPLFLCLGLLRWPYKPGVLADAPLILVPVNIAVTRGRQEFTLSLDSSQQTTPNAALLEWLRREHGLSIPGLAEPLADRAGIDVDGVLAEVRAAIADRGLSLEVSGQARLAMLDLSAFRMWQDLNNNAEHFFERPLVKHLVHTPTDTFQDPAAAANGPVDGEAFEGELEKLETPIPADSTQKRAVMWAREGRTFVLQGPPGTGKSQTITNMVAECLLGGLRVLFVAEKGTALAVVQRRLDAVGLGPFSLNLHHEGSNSVQVRAQLKRSLTTSVHPDTLAMESARRRLRNARFELTQYPERLHGANASGLSAYAAHDELLVLGDGPAMPVPRDLVAHRAEQIAVLRELFADLQRWTAAAGVRADHPWRLAGAGRGNPIDVDAASQAIRGVLSGAAWAATTTGALSEALESVTHPSQLDVLASAASHTLPTGGELTALLDATWPTMADETVTNCERAVQEARARLHGFASDVLGLDLRAILQQLEAAKTSSFFGRKGRQATALAPLAVFAPAELDLTAAKAESIMADLVAAQDAGIEIRASILATPGLSGTAPSSPFEPDALSPARSRMKELNEASANLRQPGEWTDRVHHLARDGELTQHHEALHSYAQSWRRLWDELTVQEGHFDTWRNGASLAAAISRVEETWLRSVEFERLVQLQRWCTLVRKLEPLEGAGLEQVRTDLLEGRFSAHTAEEAFARGVAQASRDERIGTQGLDLFDSVAHDQRVVGYSEAQEQVRLQWTTDGPARLLARRGGGGLGSSTGALARELEKTTRKLGTRPLLRKFGAAVQELTPLVLCSPSSVVDLIEPGVMEFDLVIFDEASQITVPEAVGALGRARAAIVVGDTKQMPPTRRVGGGTADNDEIDDIELDEVVEDQESILSECELARVPKLSLNWHYRSQDEALIAFSNRTYYDGDLSSFPTPTLLSSETGLEFRAVRRPDGSDVGMYLRAGAARMDVGNGVTAGPNTNPVEAVEIVKYVHELVHTAETLPSVGVVTFNEQQRQLIEDLLHASTDSRVAEVLDESVMGRGEALFVKALEQVQGDERDVVIFSIAFSKQANGKVPTNFGPLSNAGGERRLNVAVTRARRKNVVFCSFNPSGNDLDVSGSAYQGPKDLKQFLMDAQGAGAPQESSDSTDHFTVRDRHRDDIATALRGAGLHVMSDVGMSNFRLDLVLARNERPDRPILPVLLDGESWRRRGSVSDRDVLPVEVLENLMGWPSVARIWWPMWLQNRDEVIQRILAEVDRAEAGLEGTAGSAELAADLATRTSEGQSSEVVPEADHRDRLPAPEEIAWAANLIRGEARPSDAPQPLTNSAATGPRPPQVTNLETQTVSETSAAEPALVEVSVGASASEKSARPRFTPANTESVGAKDVLDRLPERAAAGVVRAHVLDVIETEGPVETARLARIVARRFGLTTVRAARVDDIVRLIPRAQLRKSKKMGNFAWPVDLDPDVWSGYRRADEGASRTLDEVAPQEIANAMLAILEEHEIEYLDDLLRRTADIFGVTRLGVNVRTRLEAVFATLPVEEEEEGQPVDESVIDEIVRRLTEAINSGGVDRIDVGDVRDGYVQWQGDPREGLFIEVGDGQESDSPYDAELADLLVTDGWNRPVPRDDMRNCWFILPVARNGDESERSFARRVRSMALLVSGAVRRLEERVS